MRFSCLPCILLLLLSCMGLSAQTVYPGISSLNREDPAFRQLSNDIDFFYRIESRGEDYPPLSLYHYQTENGDTVFSLAARCNLPYESLVLLNGIRSPDSLQAGKNLLLPNQPGIFIPLNPENDLEKLIYAWRISSLSDVQIIRVKKNNRELSFYYLPGERFHSLERSFFLNTLFRFPLPSGVVTSSYGMRINPFTRRKHFHHGVDIAAPQATEVYAAANGTVLITGTDDTLGNYIAVTHRGDFTTIYGHLQETYVIAGQKVQSGAIIGAVGSTGLSTGPHLHFEIRNAGESWDPSEMLHIN